MDSLPVITEVLYAWRATQKGLFLGLGAHPLALPCRSWRAERGLSWGVGAFPATLAPSKPPCLPPAGPSWLALDDCAP